MREYIQRTQQITLLLLLASVLTPLDRVVASHVARGICFLYP